MKHRLTTRDLVSVAIFAVVFFVVFYACGMVGLAGPAFMFVGWILGILLGGIILMLSVARVPKMGTMTITGLLVGLGMTPGHTIWMIPAGIVLGFLSDLIITNAGRSNRLTMSRAMLGYAVFELWMIVPLIPMLVNADEYYATITKQMGPDYATKMRALFTPGLVAGWTVVIFLLGLVGGWLGIKVGRKHFQRAGLTK
ncbi:MptD family putative ECF transporter S component [Cutibacterium equinum]|uniref:MptD family putative ECF transporter S component n=1 Tax=Cutibacterium equinum TaxID=3016342 RepID=A0ABY7QXG0_9ACTN|nr:MptD family putative ECF transporter S component [Cutibacterium equinum]WCC79735.1 MptD family putative ECF transporter S component [Cutibacterium equinum]